MPPKKGNKGGQPPQAAPAKPNEEKGGQKPQQQPPVQGGKPGGKPQKGGKK